MEVDLTVESLRASKVRETMRFWGPVSGRTAGLHSGSCVMPCLPTMALNLSHIECTALNIYSTLSSSFAVALRKQRMTVMETTNDSHIKE